MFLLLDHVREAFFGGAAGGGKSDALLMAALQYVDVPGYNAILFRRSYADLSLPGALLDRARDWLQGTDAKWDDREHTWRFPNPEYDATVFKDGATLTFAYLQTEKQKHRYASADFQFIGFDELTQFTETMYRFLFSRLRATNELSRLVPLRMRSASNPGNTGHEWVKARFVDPETKVPAAVFVPSKLSDNPSLDQIEYRRSLDELDPVTRARLLAGNWDILDEGMFKREWFTVVDHLPIGPSIRWKKVRYWDLAATEPGVGQDPDWTAGALMGRELSTGLLYLIDMRRARKRPAGVEALVKQTALIDGPEVAVWIEQEPGSAGKSLISYYQRHVLPGYTLRGSPSDADKETRAAPFASQSEAGHVHLLRGGWNIEFLNEVEGFPTGGHDDQVDAASGAFSKIVEAPRVVAHRYVEGEAAPPVVRRGDLTLVGRQYVDKVR